MPYELKRGELPHGRLNAEIEAIEPVMANLSLVLPLTKTCFLNMENDHHSVVALETQQIQCPLTPNQEKKYFVALPMSAA